MPWAPTRAAEAPTATLDDAAALDALRVEYRRLLLRLAARDLAHHLGVDDAAAELADLAAGTLEAALAVARQRVGERAALARLAVVAMGKCGGHELNYVSDVDVIFVFEPADAADVDDHDAARVATQLASHLINVCGEHTAEGTIWEVDAALRPEGKSGPLVRTLASHRGYYERWAKTWEFQALLKARPVAGDLALGREYVEMVRPMVWRAAEREGFVAETQAMRRRVIDHIPPREAERQLKLGSGGLRDVEFAVQLLQLVHGRADERIRHAHHAERAGRADPRRVRRPRGRRGAARGVLVPAHARAPDPAVPAAPHPRGARPTRTRCAGSAAAWASSRTRSAPSTSRGSTTGARSAGCTRSSSTARCWRRSRGSPATGARLSLEAAGERLAALGYEDPKAALRHLEALTTGVSRTSNIQRTLLPAMLEWFADAPDPDAGPVRLPPDQRVAAATARGTSRRCATRARSPSGWPGCWPPRATPPACSSASRRGCGCSGGDLAPLTAEALTEEMLATASRQAEPEKAVRAIRAIRRRELFRIAAGDLLGLTDVADVGAGLSRLTDATLEATLGGRRARRARAARSLDEAPTRMAIVAMGRYGGFELSYGSDADVLFVHDPVPGADPQAASSYAPAVANELRRLLALPGADPALEVDADLRPEGKQGPLVRTLDSYAAYYAKWSKVWEAQALLRADAVVGDLDLRRAVRRS